MARKPKIKTREVDHGFKGIIKELRKLEFKPIIKIGFPSESKKKDKNKLKKINVPGEDDMELIVEDKFTTVLDVAIWSEFGTVYMPERSFMRAAFDKNKKKYLKLNKKLLVDIYSGKKTVEKALDILGETILNDIKTFLINGEVDPKSFRAIDENGKTLVDTAQMMNSMTYKRVMRP